jgi:dCTP deaminase
MSFATMLDPKDIEEKAFVHKVSASFYIPPNSFVLARSLEYFVIPRGVMGVVMGKSTYARCGLIVNVTPLEPEWCGHITMELSNSTPVPVKVYPNEGIAQVLFIEGAGLCDHSYKDKSGKYQGQTGIVLPRL